MVERRIRRPADKDSVLRTLVEAGPFRAMRDALIFAAAVGYAHGIRVEFTQSGEPLRWDVLANKQSSEQLINMMAVAALDDLEVLRPERFDERITIFEEYANGGLEVISQLLNHSSRQPVDTIVSLVLEHERTTGNTGEISLNELAEDLIW